MKIIRRKDSVKRVEDDLAEKMVNEGWNYVPKSVWKELTRAKSEPNPIKETLGANVKKNKLTRKDKRKLKNEKKSN